MSESKLTKAQLDEADLWDELVGYIYSAMYDEKKSKKIDVPFIKQELKNNYSITRIEAIEEGKRIILEQMNLIGKFEKEVVRLKDLVERAYYYGIDRSGAHYSPEIYWIGFKEENNLFSKEQNPNECDATQDASSTDAGKQIKGGN